LYRNIKSPFSFQICGRKIKATDFRRAKTTIGRRAGINPKKLSRAMLHSTDVADKFYDADILNNKSSLRKSWVYSRNGLDFFKMFCFQKIVPTQSLFVLVHLIRFPGPHS